MSQYKSIKDLKLDKDYGIFDFMGKIPVFSGLLFVLTILALGVIFIKGFNYGIDFSGGAEVQVKFEKDVPVSDLRNLTEELGFRSASVQSFGYENEYLIRTQAEAEGTDEEINTAATATTKALADGIVTRFKEFSPDIRRVDTVGPQVGTELKRNGLLSVFYSLILILIYIALRFDYKYAPASVIGLLNDAIITMGIYAALGTELNIQTLAAILTVIGYSLNDTIINFDRIRENIPAFKGKPLALVINRSLNDVISRTMLTSLTTLMAIITLYYIAGGVIKDLAFTLGVGVIVGTFSTLYVAAPLVIWADKIQDRLEKAGA